MRSEVLRIGEVASRSGVSIDTVRYYERRKLLPRAARSDGGFRLFSPEAVERVLFIKQAQDMGFSLDEIEELLTTGGVEGCKHVRDILQTKITELDERLRKLQEFRRTLSRYLDSCETELNERGANAHCPVMVQISHARERKGAKR